MKVGDKIQFPIQKLLIRIMRRIAIITRRFATGRCRAQQQTVCCHTARTCRNGIRQGMFLTLINVISGSALNFPIALDVGTGIISVLASWLYVWLCLCLAMRRE